MIKTEEEKRANKAAYKKKWRAANKEKIAAENKIYREANASYDKEYRKANKENRAAYREANRENIAAQNKIYKEANKEKIAVQNKEYGKERRKSDPLFRLIGNLRNNVARCLKGGKNKQTQAILGMSFKDFLLYLEVDYTEGMHLDHIVPVSWATTDEEIYSLNHFSNFQILSAEENINKGNKFVKEANLERTLEFHNNTELLRKILERNLDKIT